MVTAAAQFTAKTTNSEKAIYFLTLMPCSIIKVSHVIQCNFFQEMGMGRRRGGSFQNKKQIKYFQLPQKKNQTVSSRKLPIFLKTLKQVTTRSRRQGITMGKHKTKAIQAI